MERAFNKIDWPKHNNRYGAAVIDDLLSGKNVVCVPGSRTHVTSITKSDFDVDQLKAIRSDLANKTVDDFNHAYKDPDAKIWTKIEKTPYSGKRGNERSDSAEVGVAIVVDGIFSYGKFDPATYKPSKRLIVGSTKAINDALILINSDKSWADSVIASGQTIAKHFATKKNFEIHHKSDLYNSLRRIGSRLSGLSADKWNPGDIMLIKPNLDIPAEVKQNIVDYNQFIGSGENVVFISLKKGDKQAQHGSYGLQKLLNRQGFNDVLKHYSNNPATIETITSQLKKLQIMPIANYLYCYGTSGDVYQAIVGDKPLPDDVKFDSATFGTAIVNGLQLMISAGVDREKFVDVISGAYLTASSRDPLSCNHYKVSGSHFEFVDKHNASTIDVDRILIPLNGTSRIIIKLVVDDKPAVMVIRSKEEGNLPQFIVVKDSAHYSGAVKLSTIKFK